MKKSSYRQWDAPGFSGCEKLVIIAALKRILNGFSPGGWGAMLVVEGHRIFMSIQHNLIGVYKKHV